MFLCYNTIHYIILCAFFDAEKEMKMFKKTLIIVLNVIFLLQINSYASISYQNRSYLAYPSLFNQSKTIIYNDDYMLIKINKKHYLYIDNLGNFIELIKQQREWQSNYNGKKYKFNTMFLNEFGIQTSLGDEEEKGYNQVLLWLFAQGYKIRAYKNSVSLQALGLLGGKKATTRDVNKVKYDIDALCRFAENTSIDEKVRAHAIRQLGSRSKLFIKKVKENLLKVLGVLHQALKSSNDRIKKAAGSAAKNLIQLVQDSQERKAKEIEDLEVQIVTIKQTIEAEELLGELGEETSKILDSKREELKNLEVLKSKQKEQLKELEDLASIVFPEVIVKQPTVKPTQVINKSLFPEEILLKDFQTVLSEFQYSGLIELEQMNQLIDFVLRESCRVRKEPFYKTEVQRINAIRPSVKSLVSEVIKLLCSQEVSVKLLGKQLHERIISKENSLNSIAKYMRYCLDRSKLLLQKSLIEQIIIPTLKGYDVSIELEEGETQNTWIVKTHAEVVTCIFSRKKGGVQFGTIMAVYYGEREQDITRYFVKSHQDYQVSRSSDMSGKISMTIPTIEPFNLKEMLVYKMLEKLGLGAKVNFVINPYARNGLFFVSEGLLGFEEGEKLEKDETFREILVAENTIKTVTPLKMAINQFDLLGRIFDLGDFNSGNFGVVGRQSEKLDWKMIDFRVTDNKIPFSLKGFLKGNTRFHYSSTGILATILKNRSPIEKKQTGIKAMENFKKDRNFYKHLEETINEIFSYIETVIPETGETIAELLGMDLDQEKQNLESYKRYVEQHFATIYEELATEQVKDIFKALVKEEGLSLSIEESEDITMEIISSSPTTSIPIRRILISNQLLQIIGRMFTIVGEEYVNDIIYFIVSNTITEERETSLKQFTRKILPFMEILDNVGHLTDLDKIQGLMSLVTIMNIKEIFSMICIKNKRNLLLENITFKVLRNVVLAA